MAIWANQGKDVLVNYNYMLRVEGVFDLPCKAVHSFTKENEFDYVQEGGVNDYVHLLRKPVTKPFTFTVERYVGTDPYPPLPLGAELTLPLILMVSPFPNRFDISKRTFVFTGCTVMSKTFGELNAEKSGLLTETIVIGYREMVEVTVPVHIGKDGKLWAFAEGRVEGNGERSARSYDRQSEAEIPLQRYWKINRAASAEGDADASADTGSRAFKTSARVNEKDSIRAVPRKWETPEDNKLGGGESSARKRSATKPLQRHWDMKKANELAKAENTPAEAATVGETAAEKSNRIWQPSARINENDRKAAELRRWETAEDEKLGGGQSSARQKVATKAVARKGGFKTLDEMSSDKKADTPRKWEFSGKGTSSAKTLEDSKAEVRRWETPGDHTLGGGKESAAQSSSDKAKGRKWPKVSSAKKRED